MNPTRRDFLRQSGALAVAATAWRPPAGAAAGARSLIVVYLRGGADFLNMVVPVGDARYQAARPHIGIGEGALPLDDMFALHPALAPLLPLYRAKQLAPVVGVGSPHGTRSHFEAQDFMERAAPGRHDVQQGWLNRYLQATAPAAAASASEFRAVAMQGLLPRALRGPYPVLAVPEDSSRRRGVDALGQFEAFYGEGSAIGRSGRDTILTLRRFQAIAAAESAVAYPEGALGQRLRAVAQVLRAEVGLEVAAIDYANWDHHTGQGAAAGKQADMLAELAGALAAFYQDLGARGARVLTVCMTEFGRTVRENGNEGTDHGRGGGLLLLGGGVAGGRVLGDWRGLEPAALIEGRDLPVTTDFRDAFAACLERSFGFAPPRGFFPGYQSRPPAWF